MSGKTRTEAQAEQRRKLDAERWAAHWAELMIDPMGFHRRRRNQPLVTVRAYPRGSKK